MCEWSLLITSLLPTPGWGSQVFWTSDFENEDILFEILIPSEMLLGCNRCFHPKKRKNHLEVPWWFWIEVWIIYRKSWGFLWIGILFESSRQSFSKDCWEGNLWARTALVKSFLISSWFESHEENQSPRSNLYMCLAVELLKRWQGGCERHCNFVCWNFTPIQVICLNYLDIVHIHILHWWVFLVTFITIGGCVTCIRTFFPRVCSTCILALCVCWAPAIA